MKEKQQQTNKEKTGVGRGREKGINRMECEITFGMIEAQKNLGLNKGRHLDTPRKMKSSQESYGPNMKQLTQHRMEQEIIMKK